ncbi:hypothetical protein GCM10017566_36110 [Amycolatopsis bartoniae]|uniref:Uncharacterized protein n=1 Tax=Amycolatopsis bartoniae TaxID=941986 RepID=A0A8H9J1B1_9PSEU|nr:hypothetical protein GCM10017566_36110 [Amycolatopsis bartoniae]
MRRLEEPHPGFTEVVPVVGRLAGFRAGESCAAGACAETAPMRGQILTVVLLERTKRTPVAARVATGVGSSHPGRGGAADSQPLGFSRH